MTATTGKATIRHATERDLDALVALRVALFRETGGVPDEDPLAAFTAATRCYLADAVPAGDFVSFVAEADGRVVSASGLIFFRRAPTARNLTGRDAYVLNMYTVPEWRGRGLATALVERILEFVRDETDCPRVFLNAEEQARPIYARAGFAAEENYMALWLDGGDR